MSLYYSLLHYSVLRSTLYSILHYIGQTGFFIVWLLYADPLSYRTTTNNTISNNNNIGSMNSNRYDKLLIPLFSMLSYIVIITLQFPSVISYYIPTTYTAITAVENWELSTQRIFIFFTILYILLQCIYVYIWFILLYKSTKRLAKLSYMTSRYIQLSYRFYITQVVLIIIYYLTQYVIVIYYILYNTHTTHDNTYTYSIYDRIYNIYNSIPSVHEWADDLNTLLREQTQLTGKMVFLTVYTLISVCIYFYVLFINMHSYSICDVYVYVYVYAYNPDCMPFVYVHSLFLHSIGYWHVASLNLVFLYTSIMHTYQAFLYLPASPLQGTDGTPSQLTAAYVCTTIYSMPYTYTYILYIRAHFCVTTNCLYTNCLLLYLPLIIFPIHTHIYIHPYPLYR